MKKLEIVFWFLPSLLFCGLCFIVNPNKDTIAPATSFTISHSDGMSVSNKADLVLEYDCFPEKITIHDINHKPVADKPFSVIQHGHALIIYKRGKRIGAFIYFNKPFEFKDLIIN